MVSHSTDKLGNDRQKKAAYKLNRIFMWNVFSTHNIIVAKTLHTFGHFYLIISLNSVTIIIAFHVVKSYKC